MEYSGDCAVGYGGGVMLLATLQIYITLPTIVFTPYPPSGRAPFGKEKEGKVSRSPGTGYPIPSGGGHIGFRCGME